MYQKEGIGVTYLLYIEKKVQSSKFKKKKEYSCIERFLSKKNEKNSMYHQKKSFYLLDIEKKIVFL